MFASLTLTQAVWVYGLGIPLYFGIGALRKKGISAFCDNTTARICRRRTNSTERIF